MSSSKNVTLKFCIPVNTCMHTLALLQGDLFMEATQTFNSWVYQSVRIYQDSPVVEFEFTVGPIPIEYELHNLITVCMHIDN